jgi:hypothetical protein
VTFNRCRTAIFILFFILSRSPCKFVTFDSAKPPALYVDESQGDLSSPTPPPLPPLPPSPLSLTLSHTHTLTRSLALSLCVSLIFSPRFPASPPGGSGGGGKGRFIQNKHSKRGGMEEAKGGAGVRLCHDLKKHPLSLGRRDDLNAKEIEINDNLVSPSDEDGAIFLHVLYMLLYC